MKLRLLGVLLLGWFALLGGSASAAEFEQAFQKQVAVFLDKLDAKQQAACVYPIEDMRRWKMQYTGGKRAGIQLSKLNPSQRASFEKTLKLVLSEEGWEMANKVAKQDGAQGLGKYYVACFGDPRQGGDFAFRLAEHHLTIVQFQVKAGETEEFGPILLGANPPELWLDDEQKLRELWMLSNDPAILIKGKQGIASRPMPADEGLLYGQLNPKAQEALKAAWSHRLRIFTPAVQASIERIHQARGGWQKSRVAFYNEVPKLRSKEGGRWDFKCGLPGMVWDFESSRGHIHMSLWARSE